MKMIRNSLVFRGAADSPTANSCFPSIAILHDGTLIATWRVGSRKDSDDGVILSSRSHDEGATWSAPSTIVANGVRNGAFGEPHYAPLTVLPDGRILCAVMWVDRRERNKPLFNPSTEGILPLSTLFLESRDGGSTWSEIGELGDSPIAGPLAITGPILDLLDGRLACPFEVNKDYDDDGFWRHAAAWKTSADGGRTWSEHREIANDPTGKLMYWDAHIVRASNRICYAAFWTYDRERMHDLTIHLSSSRDLGDSWSRPHDLGVVGQVADPVPLPDGNFLLVYVDRFDTRSIRALLSRDGGITFSSDPIIIHQQLRETSDVGEFSGTTDYLQDMNLWTFGRVNSVTDDARSVWITYYAGDIQCTGIYCARIDF